MHRPIRSIALASALALTYVTPVIAESQDPAFGTGGRVFLRTANNERTVGIHRLPDGRFLAAIRYWGGACAAGECLRVIRLNPDTSRDVSFGPGGEREYTFPFEYIADSVVDSQGRLVIAGSRNYPGDLTDYDFIVARLTPSGDPDPAMGGYTNIAFDIGGEDREADVGLAVAVDASDNIVVAGRVERLNVNDRDFGVARLLAASGTLDSSFSFDGKVAVAFDIGGGNDDQANAIAVAPDGTILVAGHAFSPTLGLHVGAITRLLPDGSLDGSFCPDDATCSFGTPGVNSGKRTYYFETGTSSTSINDILVRGDGSPVVCGTYFETPKSAGVAQFGVNGAFSLENSSNVVEAADCKRIAVQSDGKLLVAGVTGLTGDEDRGLYVRRLNHVLGGDTTYGGPGIDYIYYTGDGDFLDDGPNSVGSLELDSGRALIGIGFIAPGDPDDDGAAFRFTSDHIFSNGLQSF